MGLHKKGEKIELKRKRMKGERLIRMVRRKHKQHPQRLKQNPQTNKKRKCDAGIHIFESGKNKERKINA